MIGRKKDISSKIFQIRYNIDVQLKILNYKVGSLYLDGGKNKQLLSDILSIQEKIQSYLHDLELLLEYDQDEIEVLDFEHEEFLEDITREIEILDDTLEKTEILDDLTKQIPILEEKDELEELEILQNTMSINLQTISDYFNHNNDDIEILDDDFNEYKNNQIQLQHDILESKKKVDERIRKIRLKKKIWTIFFLLSVVCLCFLIVIILFRFYNTLYTEKQINDLKQYIVKEEVINIDDITISITSENNSDNLVIDDDLKSIDFDALLEKNSSTKGWVRVAGTNIDYPFVQADNNKFYLSHTFDKSWNYRGWVFLDYRNQFDGNDQNTIIYGHGLRDNTMLGDLRTVLEEEWQINDDNHYVTIITPFGYRFYEVFSTYKIEPEDYYITPNFSNSDDYQDFLDTLKSRSLYKFNVDLSVNDQILTLSSCYNSEYRMVLHAKLIYKSY